MSGSRRGDDEASRVDFEGVWTARARAHIAAKVTPDSARSVRAAMKMLEDDVESALTKFTATTSQQLLRDVLKRDHPRVAWKSVSDDGLTLLVHRCARTLEHFIRVHVQRLMLQREEPASSRDLFFWLETQMLGFRPALMTLVQICARIARFDGAPTAFVAKQLPTTSRSTMQGMVLRVMIGDSLYDLSEPPEMTYNQHGELVRSAPAAGRVIVTASCLGAPFILRASKPGSRFLTVRPIEYSSDDGFRRPRIGDSIATIDAPDVILAAELLDVPHSLWKDPEAESTGVSATARYLSIVTYKDGILIANPLTGDVVRNWAVPNLAEPHVVLLTATMTLAFILDENRIGLLSLSAPSDAYDSCVSFLSLDDRSASALATSPASGGHLWVAQAGGNGGSIALYVMNAASGLMECRVVRTFAAAANLNFVQQMLVAHFDDSLQTHVILAGNGLILRYIFDDRLEYMSFARSPHNETMLPIGATRYSANMALLPNKLLVAPMAHGHHVVIDLPHLHVLTRQCTVRHAFVAVI